MEPLAAATLPDDPVGAFCRENHVARAHTGRGRLSDLSFGAKDVFDIAGTPTGFGNPDWLATHPPATATAPVVDALLAAGADLRGRTVTDELTYSLSGENVHYGTPLNAAAPGRIPGGSSSGSAAAVAAGLVDFAIGTDCGGSVRLPASYCGILGIRPSHGRVSVAGVIPFAPSFDVVGWFARDAGLLERVGQVLLGDDQATSLARRLVLASDAFALVQDDVRDALYAAARSAGDRVGACAELVVSPEGLTGWFEVFRVIQAFEIWQHRAEWIAAVKPRIGPGIRERLEWAATVSADAAGAARVRQTAIRARLDSLLAEGEVLCLPTSPCVAPRRGEPLDRVQVEIRQQSMCLLCIAGLGGLPQISLPLVRHDSLPLGLSIVGRHGSDRELLRLAGKLMAAAGRESP